MIKIHETAGDNKQISEVIGPVLYASVQLVCAVFNDLPQKTQSYI